MLEKVQSRPSTPRFERRMQDMRPAADQHCQCHLPFRSYKRAVRHLCSDKSDTMSKALMVAGNVAYL